MNRQPRVEANKYTREKKNKEKEIHSHAHGEGQKLEVDESLPETPKRAGETGKRKVGSLPAATILQHLGDRANSTLEGSVSRICIFGFLNTLFILKSGLTNKFDSQHQQEFSVMKLQAWHIH